jgi:serine/threonine protein kinase
VQISKHSSRLLLLLLLLGIQEGIHLAYAPCSCTPDVLLSTCFCTQVGGKVIEGLARFIFQQLIIALDFCHRKGKVNRDIKLSNILLSISGNSISLQLSNSQVAALHQMQVSCHAVMASCHRTKQA